MPTAPLRVREGVPSLVAGTGNNPRALIVAANFPPDASVGTLRTLRLVRHLAASGWDVAVVTMAMDGFRQVVVDPALLEGVPPDVSIARAVPFRPFERLSARRARAAPSAEADGVIGAASTMPTAPAQGHVWSTVRRAVSAALALPDKEIGWLVPAISAGWRLTRGSRPDVVYSSGPPFTGHLAAMVLARWLCRPWVADFRDPWARAPWREDRFQFERSTWALFERLVVRCARAVVFATEANRRDFARQYPSAAPRFVVVPNGCDPGEFDGMRARAGRQGGRFVLLHAGSLYGARNPAPLLRALASAIEHRRIDASMFTLRFIGRLGARREELDALARRLGLSGIVEFASHMPRRESLQEMVDASALLVVQPVTTVSIPAKLYEYMAAGRPILALAEPGGDTAELMERSGAGRVAAAHDEDAIEKALVDLVEGSATRFTPVDPCVFDGTRRAAELGAILRGSLAGSGSVRAVPVEGIGR